MPAMRHEARKDSDGDRTSMSIERAIELQENAWGLQDKGQLGRAIAACEEVLHLVEQSEGRDSADFANVLNDLADMEFERKNIPRSMELALHARAIMDSLDKDLRGEDAARIRGKSLELLGIQRTALGDYPAAEIDLRQAIAIAASEFGHDSPEAALAKNNLGVLFKYSGQFVEALELYHQALSFVPEGSPESARIYHNIGGVLHAAGEFAAAEAPAEKAWLISSSLLGPDCPQTMIDEVAYAAVLDGLGRYQETDNIYTGALRCFENYYGPDHYEVAATLHNLAAQRVERGMYVAAEHDYRRALALKESILPANCPDVAQTRYGLGSLLVLTGRSREAIHHLKEAVAILDRKLSPMHPLTLAASESLRRALSASYSRIPGS